MQRNLDVLVSGAGPVGLFAAHCLTRAGKSVGIVDPGLWPCAHSYALALHPRTVDILCKAGISLTAFQRARAVPSIAFYQGRTRCASVRFNGQPLVVVPQSELEEALEKALASSKVKVEWRHKLMNVDQSTTTVRASVDRYEQESCGYVVARSKWVVAKSWTLESPFVVGADGYDSAVRRSLAIDYPEVAPCTWYAVFEFSSDADLPNEVCVLLGPETTDVLWPLGNGVFRFGFQLTDVDQALSDEVTYRHRFGQPSERRKDRLHDTAGEVDLLPDSRLSELIAERAPWFSGTLTEVGWRTVVRFERRLASTFGANRCWLAGDSAHLGNPIAVQSLNVGLAEAQDLSAAIASGSAEALDAYNTRYTAEWKRLQGVERTIERGPDTDPWVWDNRERIVSSLPAYGADLTALASQLGLKV